MADPDKQTDFLIKHYATDRAVYRQCNDKQCRAFRLDLPHSHYEYAELAADAQHAIHRLNLLDDFQATIKIEPALEEAPIRQWVSIPLDEQEWLMQKVGEYITWVETGMTRDVCKCTWILHPEKGNIRGGETALDCPAHSKEGLVLGFFTWLNTPPSPSGLLPDTVTGIDPEGLAADIGG